MDLARMMNWNDPKPIVGSNIRKIKTRFQPQGWFSGGATANPNQYIRFNFNTDGLWDPLSLYMYVEIDCSGMPVDCVYQLDNSAQNLFAQYISRVKGIELERIQEYDSLAAMLYDLNIGITERDAKAMQGLGTNRTIYQPMQVRANNGVSPMLVSGNLATSPSNPWATSTNNPINYPLGSSISLANVCGSFKPYIGSKIYLSDTELDNYAANLQPQSNNGALALGIPQLMNFIDMFNCNDIEGHEAYFTSQDTSVAMVSNHGQAYLPVNDYGNTRITQTCVGTGEWWCSSSILRNTIKSGLPCYEANSYGNFSIPLLSSLFGSVSNHGKLLPMKIFEGLEFEFLLNPNAFFVGGGCSIPSKHNATYNAGNNAFNALSSTSLSTLRTGWKVTKFEIVVDVYYLDKPAEDEYIQKLNNDGFILDIKQWYLGPKQRFTDGTSLSQTIQINNGFNSLCAMAFYFEPADYEIYPWCRKHKRISGNLTSIQLRIGNEYYPSLPIVGHSGNIRPDYLSAQQKGSYVEFYTNTMKTFGKFHNMKDTTLLNASNFTTNHVGYNPTTYASGSIISNQDVFMGSSLFFENNHVPRNLFAVDMEKIESSGNVRCGWDTTGTRPFDLILTCDTSPVTVQVGPTKSSAGGITNVNVTSTSFPRPLYLAIWMLYDSRISWNPMEGWKAEGRV